MRRKDILAAATALVFSVGCRAQTIFANNFNSDTVGHNAAPTGWSVTGGTADAIGPGNVELLPGNGNCSDSDDSSGVAGLLTSPVLSVSGGVQSHWKPSSRAQPGTSRELARSTPW